VFRHLPSNVPGRQRNAASRICPQVQRDRQRQTLSGQWLGDKIDNVNRPSKQFSGNDAGGFLTTRWAVVKAAAVGDPSSSPTAWEHLVKMYWQPLYTYSRRLGDSKEDAEDLVQTFFSQLTDQKLLSNANPEKGRFRSLLVRGLNQCRVGEFRRRNAKRRRPEGGEVTIDWEVAETHFKTNPVQDAEAQYHKEMALATLQIVQDALRQEYVEKGSANLFEFALPLLPLNASGVDRKSVAKDLGITVEAFNVQLSRLRKRYRHHLRSTVGTMLRTEESQQIDAEIRELIALISA
jgi:RNA polymerase sigma factor (sigma-70 family)